MNNLTFIYWALFECPPSTHSMQDEAAELGNPVGYRVGNDVETLCDCKTEEQAQRICAAMNEVDK